MRAMTGHDPFRGQGNGPTTPAPRDSAPPDEPPAPRTIDVEFIDYTSPVVVASGATDLEPGAVVLIADIEGNVARAQLLTVELEGGPGPDDGDLFVHRFAYVDDDGGWLGPDGEHADEPWLGFAEEAPPVDEPEEHELAVDVEPGDESSVPDAAPDGVIGSAVPAEAYSGSPQSDASSSDAAPTGDDEHADAVSSEPVGEEGTTTEG